MGSRLRSCLFIFGIVLLRVLLAFDITTLKRLPTTSARPTTVIKRIEIHKDEGNSTTINMFETKPFNARRSHTDVWSWDLWCQQQAKIGDCNNNITRYYYDVQLDQCLTFSFSGCKGNKNQFETKVDCERHCKGAAFMPLKLDEGAAVVCAMQPGTGRCLGSFPKWYFDINKKTCKSFVFGGCGGNSNQFSTYDECTTQCKDQALQNGRAGSSGEDGSGKESEDSSSSDEAFWSRQ